MVRVVFSRPDDEISFECDSVHFGIDCREVHLVHKQIGEFGNVYETHTFVARAWTDPEKTYENEWRVIEPGGSMGWKALPYCHLDIYPDEFVNTSRIFAQGWQRGYDQGYKIGELHLNPNGELINFG